MEPFSLLIAAVTTGIATCSFDNYLKGHKVIECAFHGALCGFVGGFVAAMWLQFGVKA